VAVRVDVVELEQSAFAAASPLGTRERAARAVARPDRAAHLGRDMARDLWGRRRPRRPLRPRRPPRPILRQLGELPLLQFRHQDRQRPVDDLGRIAIRDLVPQEFLRQTQLGMRRSARRELNLVGRRKVRAVTQW
jgi:hypothetical protein